MLIYIINWTILMMWPIIYVTLIISDSKFGILSNFDDDTRILLGSIFIIPSIFILVLISQNAPKVILGVKDSTLYWLPTLIILLVIIIGASFIIASLIGLKYKIKQINKKINF